MEGKGWLEIDNTNQPLLKVFSNLAVSDPQDRQIQNNKRIENKATTKEGKEEGSTSNQPNLNKRGRRELVEIEGNDVLLITYNGFIVKKKTGDIVPNTKAQVEEEEKNIIA